MRRYFRFENGKPVQEMLPYFLGINDEPLFRRYGFPVKEPGENAEKHIYKPSAIKGFWPNQILAQFWDSNGVECLPGDILEVEDYCAQPELYHGVYIDEYGELMIRDMCNSNCCAYDSYGRYFNIGPYWQYLDVERVGVRDEPLEEWWHTTREEAEKRLSLHKENNRV